MRNKPYVLFALGLLVLTIAVSVFGLISKSSVQAPSANPIVRPASTPQPKNERVVYDSSGFSPSVLKVAQGTTVNFNNTTDIPMWVASDPHPDHTDYPELDTLQPSGNYPKPRNDYSFTFTKVGRWTYHNHTQPENTATIIVE